MHYLFYTLADGHRCVNNVSHVRARRGVAQSRREDDILEHLRDETMLGFSRDLVAMGGLMSAMNRMQVVYD